MPATVTPASGSLGNKETSTLTSYTVTPAGGTTITQIVERVNGVITNTFNNPASLSRSFVVPTATWDTLAYFSSHTVTITVTDSTSATTVITYTFNKRLATDASLLEARKANEDAKNRISQKRDALATQVGLSAGATFDAISAQLASGTAVVKKATGTGTAGANFAAFTINTLNFKPKVVIIEIPGILSRMVINDDSPHSANSKNNLNRTLYEGNANQYPHLSTASVLTESGFTVYPNRSASPQQVSWTAFA